MNKTHKFMFILILLLSGCATLFSEKKDEITINTEPPGAEVYLGANFLGTTPLVHEFKRDTFKRVKVDIKKEGYHSKQLEFGRTLDKIALFNIGFVFTTGGASSWATDAFSDAMIEYEPKSYLVELEGNGGQALSKPKKSRRERLFFALFNYESLLNDIARGKGDFLNSYGDLSETTFFVNNANTLLMQQDGLALFESLETQSNPLSR